MKAVVNGTVIAEAAQNDMVKMEGSWYFPPASLNSEYLVSTATPYTCAWRGAAQYFDVKDGDAVLADHAWSYPNPDPASFERVGLDFSNYVAFAEGVQLTQ